ncbi:probable RNA polymerase II nuclear localization protein SLC7A6OS [Pristis pectinata]|uniref:probable RNA polymerase II nuclear localization protein SLC7A6OS n=1 Tax=Pristis pectinata TaxID=685728 RepID=UPI00223DC208|nr:probable RNA polymerase II nuclear localization protein SLC7A6OS [Pristis pectinata]
MAAAVLRVKRKRGAEAAEALLLACKRPRAGGEPVPGEQVVRTLFRLAGTVGSQDDTVQRHFKEAISKDKALLALKPSGTSAQRVQLSVRASCQAASQEGRYKVIASHRRNLLKSQLGDEESGTETSGAQAEEGDSQKKSSTSSGSSQDDIGSAEEIEVFDIVQREEDKADLEHRRCKDSGPGEDDPQTILCNSVRMIREKLTLSDCGLGAQHRENMEEYVYDIYYTDGYISGGGIQDILSVVPYYEEHELINDEVIADETCEDEDDENEENNWRNDYPDEDDWNREEDTDEEDGHSSSEEEDSFNF